VFKQNLSQNLIKVMCCWWE